jgi:hypothetical protein
MDRGGTMAEGKNGLNTAIVEYRGPVGKLELHGVRDEPLVHFIRKSTTKVGSAPTCDFIVPSPQVSKEHFAFHIRPNGLAFIEDLGSRNGTFIYVDGERTQIEPKVRFAIRSDQRFDIGSLGKILVFPRDLKRPESLSISDDDEGPLCPRPAATSWPTRWGRTTSWKTTNPLRLLQLDLRSCWRRWECPTAAQVPYRPACHPRLGIKRW